MKEIKMFQQPVPTEKDMLDVAVGPHYRLGTGLAAIHQRWVLALLPAIAASIYYFGPAALRVFGLCVFLELPLTCLLKKSPHPGISHQTGAASCWFC